MTNAQQSMTDLQAHALEAIKSGQAAAVEALQIWSQAVAKLTSEVPSAPVPDLKDTIGDPAVIVDSVYDFAKELIDLNKAFVHQMLEASQTATDKVTTKPPAKAASKA
jgi:hypothetical protein